MNRNFIVNELSNNNKIVELNINCVNNEKNKISLISFNVNGVKRNLNLIQEFCCYDIIFLCETSLINEENTVYINRLSTNHLYHHCSDMLFSPAKGRPYGGRSFIISKKLEIRNCEFINQHIATISINSNNKVFTIIACYLPYDNGSMINLSEFQSCIQVISELFSFYQSKMHSVLIIGDFNADLLRNKRFDIYLNNFIVNNLMVIVSPSLDSSQFSYEKGDYKAMLDHFISSNYDMVDYSCSLVDNVINLSDHKTLKVIISWFSNCFDIDN